MPTPPWSPRRSAISAHLLIQFGIDRGLGLEQCLAGSGLDIRLLGDPSGEIDAAQELSCLLYTSPSPRDRQKSRMPSSA